MLMLPLAIGPGLASVVSRPSRRAGVFDLGGWRVGFPRHCDHRGPVL